jgi:hypothetical protein
MINNKKRNHLETTGARNTKERVRSECLLGEFDRRSGWEAWLSKQTTSGRWCRQISPETTGETNRCHYTGNSMEERMHEVTQEEARLSHHDVVETLTGRSLGLA